MLQHRPYVAGGAGYIEYAWVGPLIISSHRPLRLEMPHLVLDTLPSDPIQALGGSALVTKQTHVGSCSCVNHHALVIVIPRQGCDMASDEASR